MNYTYDNFEQEISEVLDSDEDDSQVDQTLTKAQAQLIVKKGFSKEQAETIVSNWFRYYASDGDDGYKDYGEGGK